MNFTLRRPPSDDDPDRTFSVEAIEALRDQFMEYVGQQIMERWHDVGAPKFMAVRVDITWEEDGPIQ